MIGIQTVFENYLWTMFWGNVFWIFWIMWFFPRKYKYRCIRVYVWFNDDKHVIWMWIWLIPKNISLLDRIWSMWFVRFAHSPPNFIFWLDRLIFSVSIKSHPDNIYIQFVYSFPFIGSLCRVWVCFYWFHHVFSILSVILTKYHYIILTDYPGIQFHRYIS